MLLLLCLVSRMSSLNLGYWMDLTCCQLEIERWLPFIPITVSKAQAKSRSLVTQEYKIFLRPWFQDRKLFGSYLSEVNCVVEETLNHESRSYSDNFSEFILKLATKNDKDTCDNPLDMLMPRCASPGSSSYSFGITASDACPMASKLCGGLHPDFATLINARFLRSSVSYENIQFDSKIRVLSIDNTWLDLVRDDISLTKEWLGF